MSLNLLTRRRHLALSKLAKANCTEQLADQDDWFTVIAIDRPKSFKPTGPSDMPAAKSVPKQYRRLLTLERSATDCSVIRTAYNKRSMKLKRSTWAVGLA